VPAVVGRALEFEDRGNQMSDDETLSRRELLQTVAAAAGGAALLAQTGASAQAPAAKPRKRFKAWISRGEGPGRTTLQDATLRPIGGRQVVVRTEATNLCYSNVPAVLGIQPPAGTRQSSFALAPAPGVRRLNDMAVIQGHGGIGIVEAVGPEVRRVQVGDRVCVSGTPHCGVCYRCLRGRSDMCQFLSAIGPDDLVAIADLKDGTPVYQNSHIGGLAELMVTFEEWVVPIFTKLPAADVGMACSCVAVAGLGATTAHALMQIEPASSVAVVGCGPLGLSAIQGARIAGATTIIGIDPIGVRREAATKVGATHALDPNVDGDGLVARVRSLTTWPTSRLWSGGRNPAGRRPGAGADYVIEAAGLEHVAPKLATSPDPTGLLPVQQAYQMCALGGQMITTSIIRGDLVLPGNLFMIGGVTHHGGQAGGCSPLKDIPRFVEMLEKGHYDAKTLATTVVPIERMLEAYEEVAYRTTITALMTA
jgi:S-(hydroxymethyl)glutathione dehydrogenase / alcohol dehydrogenase